MDRIQYRRIGTTNKLVKTVTVTQVVDASDLEDKDYTQEELKAIFKSKVEFGGKGKPLINATELCNVNYTIIPMAVVGEQVNHIAIEACIMKDPDN